MSTETVYVLHSHKAKKSGKVTISRNDRLTMRTLVCIRFLAPMLFLLIVPLIIVIQRGWVDSETVIFASVFGLVLGLTSSAICKGTMVESVCFDYDNSQVIVGQTNMKNQHTEVVIPFRSCVMKTQDPSMFSRRPAKLTIIQGGGIKAVLVYDRFMEWNYYLRERIEEELMEYEE